MRLAFVPKTTEFYDFFTRAGENLLATARLAEQRFREFPETSIGHEQGEGPRELGRRADPGDHRPPQHRVHHAVTWYLGLPSSSSHALIGGVIVVLVILFTVVIAGLAFLGRRLETRRWQTATAPA